MQSFICLFCVFVGLRNLVSLLGTSTDLSVFLSCLSSHLQAFVFQPSRSKEEFIKLAASFQLRWNLLLTAVSKAMTLCHRDSFGSWHLFHLLLLEYVIHILQSCLEEEEEEEDMGNIKEMLPDDPTLGQPDQALFHPLNSSWPQMCAGPSVESLGVTPTHVGQGRYPVGVSNMVLRILGFLVDTATGNKVGTPGPQDPLPHSCFKGNKSHRWLGKPSRSLCPYNDKGFYSHLYPRWGGV